jgi:hypothetical protein
MQITICTQDNVRDYIKEERDAKLSDLAERCRLELYDIKDHTKIVETLTHYFKAARNIQ